MADALAALPAEPADALDGLLAADARFGDSDHHLERFIAASAA